MKYLKKFNENNNQDIDDIKSCFDEITLDKEHLFVDVRYDKRFSRYQVQIVGKSLDETWDDDYSEDGNSYLHDLSSDKYLFDLDEGLIDDIESGIKRCELNGYRFNFVEVHHNSFDENPSDWHMLDDLEFEIGKKAFCIYIYLIKKIDKIKEEIYYPDLSPHHTQKILNNSDSPNAKEFLRRNNYVNIGWLEPGHDFPKGDVGPKLVEKIKKAPVSNLTKGWHNCLFCDNKEDAWTARSSKERKIPGKNGISYCYPDMLAHYIEKHNYLPPQEFLDAVEEYVIPEEPKQKEFGRLSGPEMANLQRLRRKKY